MSELSLEELDTKLDGIQKLSNDLNQRFMAMNDKDHGKDAATENEDEKMKAKRAKRDAAIKKAEDEVDDDKKDAALRKAVNEMDDKKHDASEDKETKEHVASIIEDSKRDLQVKILQASIAINPATAKSVEDRIKTASLTELKTEWSHIEPFVATVATPQTPPQTQAVIPPYQGSYQDAGKIDAAQLNASSPDSAFVNIPTKELLGDDL